MKVLIVGGGAVGQVFALHLQKDGVTLGLFELPANAEKLQQALNQVGLPLYQTTFLHRRKPIVHTLKNYQVLTDITESQRFKPDQIWFTVPSPVYYSTWFQDFLQQVPSKQVVCFAPEGGRPEFFPDGAADRVVFGGTTFMAWQGGPLAGGGHPGGINFYRSPLGIPLTGKAETCREVARLLKKAGFRVTIEKPGSDMQASATAVMTAFVAGLELAGWSLKAYRKSPWLKQAVAACREAVLSQTASSNALQKLMLSQPVLTTAFSLTTLLLPLLMPFDINRYLGFHYRKTGKQTLTLLEVFISDGMQKGQPVENIQILLQALRDSA
jgi:2-dehydropantoate 2-reductase